MHELESTHKNEMHKIPWNFEIQTRPDLVLIYNFKKTFILWILPF